MNLASFVVETVMVHDVPKGNDKDEALVLTDDPIDLDDDLRAYFRRKIVTSLEERGVEVVADPNEDAAVRTALAGALTDPGRLAEASRTIAQRLDDVQTGRNSAGLLAVAVGHLDGKRCLSVLKLEREQGLRFQILTVNGRRVIDLQHLRDLTLTDKTKVFKTSILTAKPGGKPTAANVVGRVSDDQRGAETTAGVATFFLSTFLGCRLRDSPGKTTLQFVQAFDEFVSHEVLGSERRGRYQVALLAALQDQTPEIRPRSFANTHLDAPDRPGFLDRVQEVGLDPGLAFQKDTALVRIKGFKMTFDSGMVLVGTREDLDERVHIRADDAADPGVNINDAIKALRGR